MSAQRLLSIVCVAAFWLTGRIWGEFYPFSPLGMFNSADTVASRLFVLDANGDDRDIGNYVDWVCEGPLQFESSSPTCPAYPFAAYDEIVLDHIQSHPAPAGSDGLEALELKRRVFEIPDPVGPVQITDCPIMRCRARRREPSLWTPRL